MPSPHPTLGLRIPAPLYAALKDRAEETGTTANTYILLLLAAELGFGDSTNNDVTKWLLSQQRAKEQRVKAVES